MKATEVPGIAGALPVRADAVRRTSAASSAAPSTADVVRSVGPRPGRLRPGQRLPLGAGRACAACTCAPARARPSWCGARTARSSTSSWTCGPDSPTYRNRSLLRPVRREPGDRVHPGGVRARLPGADRDRPTSRTGSTAPHDPSEDVTIAFDDPDLAIPWPLPVTLMSERDKAAPASPRPWHTSEADMTEDTDSATPVAAANKRLHALIPGGAHTYAKGEDQYPEDMAPVISARPRRPRLGRRRQRYIEYGSGLRVGQPRARATRR